MPRNIKITPKQWELSDRWIVSLPPTVSPNGKRQRLYFKTKQEAQTFCDATKIRIQNFGAQGSKILPASKQEQAAAAFAALEPYNVTLTEVVQDWIEGKKAAEASITFEKGMDDFLANPRKGKPRSKTYKRSIIQTRDRLTTLHEKLLSDITHTDIDDALDGMKPSVRNFTIRILGGLFNYGIRKGKCAENPLKKVDGADHDTGEIQIHTPADVAVILDAVEKHNPELVPFFAISFFTGIRRAEALRLDWSAIDLHENFVKLPAAITKKNRTRHIDISENCRAWLALCTDQSGKLVPYSNEALRNRERDLRAIHGVAAIKHGARHSFASYHLAMHNDIDKLCQFMGHEDTETLFRHYAKAATKRDAEKYWAISPSASVSKKIVRMRVA